MKIEFTKINKEGLIPEKISNGVYLLKSCSGPQLVQPVDQDMKAVYTTGYSFKIDGGYGIVLPILDLIQHNLSGSPILTIEGELGFVFDVSFNKLQPNLYKQGEAFASITLIESPEYEELYKMSDDLNQPNGDKDNSNAEETATIERSNNEELSSEASKESIETT